MAFKGVWQLQKLTAAIVTGVAVAVIDRAFMEKQLPTFREKNPQLEVVTELIHGQHTHLKGFCKNKNQRVICVKKMDPEDILLHATRLRNSLGRNEARHVTHHPSVQGTWTTDVKF